MYNEARYKESHSLWFHLYEVSKMSKSVETEIRLVVSSLKGGEKREGTECLKGIRFPFRGIKCSQTRWRSS